MSMRRTLLLASSLALAGCAAAPPSFCSLAETQAGCAVATQLFLGLSRPDGTDVSAAEWQSFLAETVTPRFPAGFTISAAEGQWRILLIVHRAGEDEAAIAALIDVYKARFRQQSVLRLDTKAIAHF
jgi:hypothetical protein